MWSGAGNFDLGAAPTTKEAQAISDELYADFVSEDVDKVEMIYTKFVSLIASDPIVQTLLPLTPQVRFRPIPAENFKGKICRCTPPEVSADAIRQWYHDIAPGSCVCASICMEHC